MEHPYWSAGASIDITPITHTSLAGYAGRTQPWTAISSRLEANAILLTDGHRRILFFAADLLYIGADLLTLIAERAAGFGLGREQIVVTASHTHFAPATDRSKPLLGEVDARYRAHLREQVLRLLDAVLSATLEQVSVTTSRVEVDLNVNRRRRWPLPVLTRDGLKLTPSTVMAPAPSEPTDPFVDVLRIVDVRGKVVSVMWKYACHPVCFPEPLTVGAEYPGHAREILRETLDEAVPVVFWQGFTGDVRPKLHGKKSWIARLQSLRRGPGFGDPDMAEWLHWADGISTALIGGVRNPRARAITGALGVTATEISIADILDTTPPQPVENNMLIQRIAFGDQLAVNFLGAEVCSPYLELLGASERTLCVGYAGDVFGYLPSEHQAREGGYEGGGYLGVFGMIGKLRPGFELKVVDAVDGLRPRAEPVA